MGKVFIVKMLYNLIIIIIFTFLFQSCSNEKKEEIINTDKEQLTATHNLEQGFSTDEHPCLCLISADRIKVSTRKSIFKESRYADQFNGLDLFNISMESAILFKHYTEFAYTLESVILRKEIDEYFNPKAYFIKAIREISQQKLDDARISLNEFLSIQKKYKENNKKYFQLGCYQKDIDFITNFEATRTYKIAKDLLTYCEARLSGNKSSSLMTNMINSLKSKHDISPNEIDLIENIIFSILKSEEISANEYNLFLDLDSSPNILYSPIHEMFDDGREFFFPSQLNIISLSKYYQAANIYKKIDWDKIDANLETRKKFPPFPDWEIDIKHLYSLMRYYEFQLETFMQTDSTLYQRIDKIVNNLGYDNCDSWLKHYNPNKDFNGSAIGNIISKLNNNISPDDLMTLIDAVTDKIDSDSTSYFKTRELLVNQFIFNSISSDTIKFIIEKPNDYYKNKIDSFLDLALKFDIPDSYRLQVEIPKNYYSIYNLNNENRRVELSSNLNGKKILNEGNEAVSRYWDFVRSYFEIHDSGKSTNKCKDTDEGDR